MRAMQGRNQILIIESDTNVSKGLIVPIEQFVQKGGTLVIVGPSPPWLRSLGASNLTTTQSSTDFLQKKLDFWTKNTVYFHNLKTGVHNGLPVASGSGLNLTLIGFGSGQVVALNHGSQDVTLQNSQAAIVLSNIVENTFSPGSVSPFWNPPKTNASLSPL